jgi:molecular chaperone GrpE
MEHEIKNKQDAATQTSEPGPKTDESGAADTAPAADGTAAEPKEVKDGRKGHDHEDARSLKGKLKKKDHELKELRQAAEALRAEASGLKDRYLRAAADMDNQRKRFERERTEYLQFAQGDLFKDLLSVLDNFERALKTRDTGEGAGFQEGVELIAKQLQDLVRKRGLTPVASVGEAFDPSVHQAVLTEEAEGVEEPVIGEELQKGYKLHDRLLRPALVKVLVPKSGS